MWPIVASRRVKRRQSRVTICKRRVRAMPARRPKPVRPSIVKLCKIRAPAWLPPTQLRYDALGRATGVSAVTATRIVLIDDDVELLDMLRTYMEREGFEVAVADNGEAGAAAALAGDCALVVLDVMMPKMSGIEVLKRIRAASRIPVLMLTAKGDDADRIVGLELGADDYVPKPCTPRELVARVRAILRRTQATDAADDSPALVEAGPLRLYPRQRRAEWAGRPLDLTSTEFNLLDALARSAGHVVSKDTLSEYALGRPLARFDRSIDVHVSSIRRKLGTLPDGRSWIQTVVRQGYQLIKD
jgi:two-component system OmpR family response regulator